jgi:hypothetical protein
MPTKKWWRPAAIFLYYLVLSSLLYYLFSNWAYDDPFITYRYAQNLRSGIGFTYNPNERVLSTTSPLFALLLSFLHNSWIDLPKIGVLVGVISLMVGSYFIWDLSRTWKAPIVGWLGIIFYPTFPLLLSTLSSETPLYLALCLGTFSQYARKKFISTAILSSLAVLSRPDAALIPLLLSIHYVLTNPRAIPWRSIGTFAVITLPWFIFAWIYFGSPIPVTLAAKQLQGSMEISQRFATGLWTILQYGYTERWQYWLAFILAIVGIIWTIRVAKQWSIFIAWPILYFISYTMLGVSRYFWYYAPLVPGFLIAVGMGVTAIWRYLKQSFPNMRLHFQAIGLISLVAIAFLAYKDLVSLSEQPDNRFQIYRAVGEWLESHSEVDGRVGALEVGIIGFYSNRYMVDFAGIIQPPIAERLQTNSTYEDSARWGINNYLPEILVLDPSWFPALMKEVVTPQCEGIYNFEGDTYSYSGNLMIYQCTWPPSTVESPSADDASSSQVDKDKSIYELTNRL